MGHRNLPRVRRTMPTLTLLLGPQHERNMFQRERIHRRQPSLQRSHGLRDPRPAHPNDLEPAPRMARQARPKRGIRPRHLRLLRQHLPHRRALLDQPVRPNLHRLPGDAVDAHRACRWSDLLQLADYPRSVPGV